MTDSEGSTSKKVLPEPHHAFLVEETPPLDSGDLSISGEELITELKTCCTDLIKPTSRLPVIKWIREYSPTKFLRDFIAGITVALTVIPQGMAYASVAGLPEVYGLYSSFVGPLVYIFLGTSKDITMGPTAVMSLIVSAHASSEYPEYAVLLTFTCGLVQILIAVLQLGFLLNFVSHPVISGFTSGAAVLIAYGQVKDLTGIPITSDHLIPQIVETFENIKQVHLPDLILGTVCLIALLVLRRLKTVQLFPNAESTKALVTFRYVVWLTCTASNAIVVILASVFVYTSIRLDLFGFEFNKVGEVQSGFPQITLPPFGFVHTEENIINGTKVYNETTVSLVKMASDIQIGFIIVPLLGILESIAIAKSFSRKNGYRIDPTQEIFAIGIANTVSSFFQSYPITGSFSRTAVNSQSNVATPLGGLFTSVVVILSLLFLAPAFQFIPKSSLAALIISSIIFNFDYSLFRVLWRIKKVDFISMSFTVLMCCVSGAEYGIISGIVLSLLLSLWPLARPKIQSSTFEEQKLKIVKFAHGLSFPSSEIILDHFEDFASDLRKTGDAIEFCVIDLARIWNVDYAVICAFSEIIKDLKKENVSVYFIRGNHGVIESMVRAEQIVPEFNHFATLDEAIAACHSTGSSFSDGVPVENGESAEVKFQALSQSAGDSNA